MRAASFPWPTDLRRAGAAAWFAFDHFAEAVGSVGMLALQMCADRVEFHLANVPHNQRAIGGPSVLRFG